MSNPPEGMPRWASKVPRAKIQRLYETDAQGIVDPEMIDSVGWALWDRCDSILAVTAAHHGHVQCPSCKTTIECMDHSSQDNSSKDELIACAVCGWQILWSEYHQTFRGKQLFGANAVEVFRAYHEAFPQARAANAKMLLIDQLIHGFHTRSHRRRKACSGEPHRRLAKGGHAIPGQVIQWGYERHRHWRLSSRMAKHDGCSLLGTASRRTRPAWKDQAGL